MSDTDSYLKMYELVRAESEKYHETIWKVAIATVVGAAGVSSFFIGHTKEAVEVLGPVWPLIVLGGFIFIIGATGAGLTHMYVVYRETTYHLSNVYRNAWLANHPKPVLSDRLSERYKRARAEFGPDFLFSSRWTILSVLIAVAGLAMVVAAATGFVPLKRLP